MKKLILLFCLLISALANAQDYQKLAQETCDCINKKDLTGATSKSIEMALGFCMLEVIQKNNIDIEITDSEAMGSFGEKIGLQMAILCPSIFGGLVEESLEGEDDVEVLSLSGKIKSIEDGDFLFLILKEESGKETRLIWLRYFSGSDDYLTDPRKLIGKKVVVKYQSTECYLPKAKGYFAYKEITELKMD